MIQRPDIEHPCASCGAESELRQRADQAAQFCAPITQSEAAELCDQCAAWAEIERHVAAIAEAKP